MKRKIITCEIYNIQFDRYASYIIQDSLKIDNKSVRNMSENKQKIKMCCPTSWY